MDLDTDSVTTEKENPTLPPQTYQYPTQQLKADQNPTQPPITYPNPTQQIKTEQESAQKPQEEQPWGASEWNQNGWWGGITSVGTAQSIGDQTYQRRK